MNPVTTDRPAEGQEAAFDASAVRRRQTYHGTFPTPGELALIMAAAVLAGGAIVRDPFPMALGSAILIVLALLLQTRRQW